MNLLSPLICGPTSSEDPLSSLLANMAAPIDSYFENLIRFSKNLDANATLFAPFCARALLEVSFTALLGRIDPFRLLIIHGFQNSSTYQLGKRNLTAIQWNKDILPDDIKTSKSQQVLWNQSLSIDKISRSLFSPHIDKIYWEPAFDECLDNLGSHRDIPCLERLGRTDASSFIPRIKGAALQLYPALSKGVHIEFVIPIQSKFDETTLLEYINQTLETVVDLGTVSHFIKPQHIKSNSEDLKSILQDIHGVMQ